MKPFKKIIAVAVSALCCISVCACAQKDTNPAPHKAPDVSSVKKGVCVSRYNAAGEKNAGNINALNAGWYYNWGVRPQNENIDAEFVPMIWGAGDVTAANISYIKTQYESGNFSHLLTFNEPDVKNSASTSANMTVEQAIALWPQLESIGIPLSSPVVAFDMDWLDKFMTEANDRNYRVDFIAVHLYQCFYEDNIVNVLMQHLDEIYSKYSLPIWLTEFGASDTAADGAYSNGGNPDKKLNAKCTARNASTYVELSTDRLEQCGYVQRYSWFLDNFQEHGEDRTWHMPYTSLYNDDDSISQTGKTYRDVKSNLPLYVISGAPENVKAGEKYSFTVSVCGGTGDYTFSATGLPEGLTMAKNGEISGKCEKIGNRNVTVTVTDSGRTGRRQTLNIWYAIKVIR